MILTTSQLLTTEVDAPTCQNVVLVRVVGSMTEFKQIIGRGTRVRDDKGKLFFNILDYTGSATQKGIDFNELAASAGTPDADPFDLLCHLAYNAPLLTRKQRAEKLRTDKKDFFDQYGPEARTIINELLDKYAEHGTAQFTLPDVFEVPPISEHGNLTEIAAKFGGIDSLAEAFKKLQEHLYVA